MNINLSDPNLLISAFGFGIVVRSLFIIKNRRDFIWVGLTILIAGGAAFNTNSVGPGSIEEIFRLFLLYAFVIAIVYCKNILVTIREDILLFNTIVFNYMFLKNILPVGVDWTLSLFFVSVPVSFVIFVLSFVKLKLNNAFRIFFYIWYLILNISFVGFYFFSQEISLSSFSDANFTSPVGAFIIGFTTFSLLTNIGVLSLWILSKFGSTNDARKYANLLISKHNNGQLRVVHSLLIFMFGGGFLLVNYFFNLVDDGIIIPLYLFLGQYVFGFKKNDR